MQQYVEKAKAVLMTPTQFFGGVGAEQGYSEALKYYAIFALIGFVAGIGKGLLGGLGITTLLIAGVTSYVLSIIITFLSAGITHILAKLIGGAKGFDKTYRLYVYAMTPVLLIGWIPIVSLIGMLYSFYLTMKGLSVVYGMSMRRAAVIVILPILVIFILTVGMAGLAYMYITDMFSMTGIPTGAATALGLL